MSATDRRRQALQPKKNRGSAGRSDGERTGRPPEKTQFVNMEEFGRACDAMLVAHVPGYRVRNFYGKDVTDQVLADLPQYRRAMTERVPVVRVFWKSKNVI